MSDERVELDRHVLASSIPTAQTHSPAPSTPANQPQQHQLKLIQTELALDQARSELQATQLVIARLEQDRLFLVRREESTAQVLKRTQTTKEEEVNALSQSLSLATKRALKAEESAKATALELASERRASAHQAQQAGLHAQTLGQELSAVRKECASYQSSMSALTATHTKVLHELADLKQKRPSALDSVHLEDQMNTITLLNKQLLDQHRHITTIENALASLRRENAHLKEIQQSNEQLSECIRGLEAQVAHHLSQLPAQAALETECAALRGEKADWVQFLAKHHAHLECATPYELAKALSEARLEIARLSLGLGGDAVTGPRSTEARQEIDSLKQQLTSAQEDKKALTRKIRDRDLVIRKAELTKGLVDKELECLRALLASYESEASVSSSTPSISTTSLLREKERHLEALLAEYKIKLANSPLESSPFLQTNDEEELTHLRQWKANAQHQMEMLNRKIYELHHRIGQGLSNPSTTRILQLRDNPESQVLAVRQAELDALRQENAKLTQLVMAESIAEVRMVGAEERCPPSLALGGETKEFQTQHASLLIEMEALKQDLAQQDKRMTRLKEVYTIKVKEYRQAIFILLGYKVDIHPTGRVELTSAFASSSSGEFRLVFSDPSPSEASSPSLLTSPADGPSMSVVGRVEEGSVLHQVLHSPRSGRTAIPEFLATLTLRLIDQQQQHSNSTR